MEKNENRLSDYIHLYIGCHVMLPDGATYLLKPSNIPNNFAEISNPIHGKLILRKLSDITATEYTNLTQVIMGYDGGRDRGAHAFQDMLFTIKSAPVFAYLLKQGFDLFGLIDASLALDKSTLT